MTVPGGRGKVNVPPDETGPAAPGMGTTVVDGTMASDGTPLTAQALTFRTGQTSAGVMNVSHLPVEPSSTETALTDLYVLTPSATSVRAATVSAACHRSTECG